MRYPTKLKQENVSKVKDLFYEYCLGAKPFLKWAGGKNQLLSVIKRLYPQELKEKKIKYYYEPFVGGGAVFFDIAQNYEIDSAFLYDINEELVLAYHVIQKDVNNLIEFLERYSKQFLNLNKEKREKYFYDFRHNFNLQRFNIDYKKYSENWIPRAAQIIFLNKTCYNGLFRFNSKGEFNSPIGLYENPTILDEANLLNVSKLLEIAEIKKADFKEVKDDIKNGSFVYFDPPYRPLSKTSNFTSYSKYNFRDDEQIQLATLFNELNEKGILQMLSNSDPKNTDPTDNFFDLIYKEYNIIRVPAKRIINSNASKRNHINEIIVTNYSIEENGKRHKR
ncbi:MAG: Dam family site-specific DNA-(adenine-N6)-methyltransferase [Bacteroidales bacterium]|nr:Dam family site-specific DNA-(adenine-N6)-methyltransferase [Bacteroidales bacterium]